MLDANQSNPATDTHLPEIRAQRGVITLAFGAPKYVDMAKDLARSMALNSPRVTRAIATDSRDPELNDLFHHICQVPNEVLRAKGLESKLFLDRVSPFEETFFLDSDTLVFAELDDLWDRFTGRSFAPVGKTQLQSDWFADPKRIQQEFGFEKFASFNGGLYYFRRDDLSAKIFDTARQLRDRYDELGMARLSGGISEEPIYCLAMSMNRLAPVSKDQGPVMSVVRGKAVLDVLTGKRLVTLADGTVVEPHVVHFCSRRSWYGYRRECYRLRAAHGSRRAPVTAELSARLRATYDYSRLRMRNARIKIRERFGV
jgi:hypothetical protein